MALFSIDYLNKPVWFYGLLPTTGTATITVDIPDK